MGPLKGHSGPVRSVAFSPDGHRIVSGSEDNTIRVWDAETGKVLVGPLKGLGYSVSSIASSDGHRIVASPHDDTVQLWNAETGGVVAGPLNLHRGSVWSVAFSPDGHRIVSGAETIQVWDAETGEVVVGPFTGHDASIRSVAFSSDGRCIVSGSEDKTIRVWDPETGEIAMGPLKGHSGPVMSVAFSPDGHRIVSGSQDMTIRVQCAVTSGSKTFSEQSASFTDNSTMKGGWMLGSNSELLFWVPPTLRAGLLRPGNTLFIGEPVATRLDLSSFVHGESWSLCRTPQGL